MRKLIDANFCRLWRDKVFWIVTVCAFGFGVFIICNGYRNGLRMGFHAHWDEGLMYFVTCGSAAAALFISMFIGTDYSDGTIRNKLIVGHTRAAIYLANWLTGTAAALLTAGAYLLPYCGLGILLLSAAERSPAQIAAAAVIGVFVILAFVSLFTLLSMLITRRSYAGMLCILLFLGLVIVSGMLQDRLDAPELLPQFSIIDGVEQVEMVSNPQYLQPAARRVYQFLMDVLPSGQLLELLFGNVAHPFLLPVYSLAVSAAATALGIYAFRKKDLK